MYIRNNLKSHSFNVETPEEYRQLMNGQLAGDFQFIDIAQSAGGQLLDVFKIPSIQKYRFISIIDKYNNAMNYSPQSYRSVNGRFVQGESLLAILPRDCMKYEISLGSDVIITTADIDAMLTWSEATRINIADSDNLAYDLSQRIHEMGQKWLIEGLSLTVQRHSYKQLDVVKILKKLLLLGPVYFKAAPDMTDAEMEEFAANQDPAGFYNCKLSGRSLMCKRY